MGKSYGIIPKTKNFEILWKKKINVNINIHKQWTFLNN